MTMVFRASFDPTTDDAAASVLAAFNVAEREGLPTVECYCAGVDAWRRMHPDQTPVYAARQAVTVILAIKGNLRIWLTD